MNRKRIIHGLGRRENINKAEQPHKHDQPNHVSAQHIIYSLSYLQSISRIFSHYVHFTTNCHWLRGASCRLLNFYDVFWDKQASAIVFHIYNLTDRGAELKQSFMGERMSASWKKKKKKKVSVITSSWTSSTRSVMMDALPSPRKNAGYEMRSSHLGSALLNNAKQ